MRVISGKLRGKKLEMLKEGAVRPTTDKVKESIFNVIQFDVVDAIFLDLFAGSGQMGIEALSRGAKGATFVDKNRSSIDIVRKNLISTRLFESAEVAQKDAISFLTQTQKRFDIAFLDPPYKTGLLQEVLGLVVDVMSKSGIIICEHPVEEILPASIKNFSVSKSYKYGKIKLTVYKKTCLASGNF